MHIRFNKPIHHWNYFLSIEEELMKTAKFVEFDLDNKKTFSIEYTKIILEACSEVDVLLNQIGKIFGQDKKRPNFKDHFKIIDTNVKTLITENLCIEQYGIDIQPYEEWTIDNELDWHRVYNNLKHNRGEHYKKGNLENTLLSVGALFTTVIHYYRCLIANNNPGMKVRISDVNNSLVPKTNLIKFSNEEHYINV